MEEFDGLVIGALREFRFPESWRNDLYQAGWLGLLKGLRSFKPGKTKVTTYVHSSIRWSIKLYIKKETKFNTRHTLVDGYTLNEIQ